MHEPNDLPVPRQVTQEVVTEERTVYNQFSDLMSKYGLPEMYHLNLRTRQYVPGAGRVCLPITCVLDGQEVEVAFSSSPNLADPNNHNLTLNLAYKLSTRKASLERSFFISPDSLGKAETNPPRNDNSGGEWGTSAVDTQAEDITGLSRLAPILDEEYKKEYTKPGIVLKPSI